MRNRFLATLLLVSLVGTGELFAQKSTVHLKNGSSIKGEIIEYKQGEYLVIKLFQGHEARFSFDEIDHYKIRDGKNSYGLPPLGYFNYTSTGLVFSKINQWGWVQIQANPSVHTINGYRFHKLTSGGLGLGLDRYGQTSAAPVYLSIRRDLWENRVTPTFNASFGYAWMWESKAYNEWQDYSEVDGGIYWELGGGLRINYKKAALLFNMSYKHQHSTLTINNDWGLTKNIIKEKHNYRNLAFTVGVEF